MKTHKEFRKQLNDFDNFVNWVIKKDYPREIFDRWFFFTIINKSKEAIKISVDYEISLVVGYDFKTKIEFADYNGLKRHIEFLESC